MAVLNLFFISRSAERYTAPIDAAFLNR